MEWLTTGQMIDKLADGEIAQSNDNTYLPIKNFDGDFHWVDSVHFERVSYHKDALRINNAIKNLKWRIFPKYVTFEEAMKALNEGKSVHFYPEESQQINAHKDMLFANSWFSSYSFGELINGKWTIDE